MMTKEQISQMSEQDLVNLARRVYSQIRKNSSFMFLLDLAHKEMERSPENEAALRQFIQIFFDLLGAYYEEFEQLEKSE